MTTVVCATAIGLVSAQTYAPKISTSDWLDRWQGSILAESKTRYCDTENGEEVGWLISPFLDGFYYGYLATHDEKWIDRLVDWSDSWIARGVKEPDGFVGWPKIGSGGLGEEGLYIDSLLGEAMALTPIVRMSGEIQRKPRLRKKYGAKAEAYLKLAESIFRKWDSRQCWMRTPSGGVWVVRLEGIDRATGRWAAPSALPFTNPDNKQNLIAEWMLAMSDVLHKPIYRDRATQWWQVMKSRMKLQADGKYLVWDYWDPAGQWDFNGKDGTTRHWVGVHPNGGYYGLDVSAIVEAYEHRIVFTASDIEKLVATNRDYMWNGQIEGAKFRSIGGGEPDPRWKDSPGVIWPSLAKYDSTLREVFEDNFNPAGWGGLSTTPWYLWRSKG